MKALRPSQKNQLLARLEKAIVGKTPAMHMSVFLRGDQTFAARLGQAATYFDLASLTKVIFTTSCVMRAVEGQRLQLDALAKDYLPWFPDSQVRVRELLSHSSGFRWWAPFYQELDQTLSCRERWMQLQVLLKDEKTTRPIEKAVYSDLDFLFLGLILESVEGRSLLEIWNEYQPAIGAERLHFCENNRPIYPAPMYAPTEICPWRHKLLQGEVHDENAWALGGIAPHAGLFGRLDDVESWALALRESHLGLAGGFVSPTVTRQFLSRQMDEKLGDWGLGFMMPTRKASSSGQYFSSESFGHTGFTGTSFWWDQTNDVMILILANRVHPTRENRFFVELRPQIHDWVMEQLRT